MFIVSNRDSVIIRETNYSGFIAILISIVGISLVQISDCK